MSANATSSGLSRATISTDAGLGNRFRVTLGGNRTLANPTNAVDGQQMVWEIIQDATGSRTITLGTKFVLGTDITAVTLTTTEFSAALYLFKDCQNIKSTCIASSEYGSPRKVTFKVPEIRYATRAAAASIHHVEIKMMYETRGLMACDFFSAVCEVRTGCVQVFL